MEFVIFFVLLIPVIVGIRAIIGSRKKPGGQPDVKNEGNEENKLLEAEVVIISIGALLIIGFIFMLVYRAGIAG